MTRRSEPTESVTRRSAPPESARSQPTPEPAAPRSVFADVQRLFTGLPNRLPVKVSWWGAILLAVTSTAVGFAYDAGAGNGELGAVFSTFYVIGCLAAVLFVQRPGLFTAMIQPPLILFVAVPTAYFLLHRSQIEGLKDILINCGYPLIERFPLMFFTAAVVLLLGLARWYLLRDTADDTAAPSAAPRRAARRFAKTDAPADEAEPPRAARRPRRAATDPTDRPRRASRTGAPSRARHNRPPESDIAASAAAADRRERAAARARSGRPRRHAEPPVDPAAWGSRDPRDQRDLREPRRRARYDDTHYDDTPYDGGYGAPLEPSDSYERPRRRPRPEGYEPRYSPRPDDRFADPYAERPRRPAPDPSHHPISRVRYRSSEDDPRSRHRDTDFWDTEN